MQSTSPQKRCHRRPPIPGSGVWQGRGADVAGSQWTVMALVVGRKMIAREEELKRMTQSSGTASRR